MYTENMQNDEDFSAIVRADLKDSFDEQDNNLRPQFLSDFLGQESVKKNLSTFIEAAKLREEPLDHLLLIVAYCCYHCQKARACQAWTPGSYP